jgi:hypothetical protein
MKRAISSRRLGAALALLTAIGVVLGLILSSESPSKPNGANGAAASGAATVERRDLVEADTEAGTLSYADPETVYDRLSGTITWLPSIGQPIKPGGTLFMVDGRPVILMDGTTPAYRELAPRASSGRDVAQLNRDLVGLGYDPAGIVQSDEWQAATTAGVEDLQASLGETETGKLTLGEVVFLPGEQLVSTVEATLGGDGSGSGSGNPSGSSASDRVGAGAIEYASLETPTPKAAGEPSSNPTANRGPNKDQGQPRPTSTRRLEALIARLEAEVNGLKSSKTPGVSSPKIPTSANSPSSETPSSGSDGGASPTPILQTTSTRLVVTVELAATKQGEAKTGEPVTVELPSGESVNGTITAVSPVAKSSGQNAGAGAGDQGSGGSGSGSSGSTVPVTIALSGRHTGAGLDQAAVSVNFAHATAKGVLAVPVTALLATGGARYAVQEALAPHELIPVTTGLFAGGFVEISGPGIYPGLQVTDSQG